MLGKTMKRENVIIKKKKEKKTFLKNFKFI